MGFLFYLGIFIIMSKKIIINENQLKLIKGYVSENVTHVRLKNKIHNFLDADYEPSSGVQEISNEFYTKPLVKKKIDGESITIKALCDYMSQKFSGIDRGELNDSIKGWFYGDYDKETGMRKKK